MFRVSGGEGASPTVVLQDESAGSRVEVAPARGGMVRSFWALGRDWLFLDEATFANPAQNVRGGIPVLFPSPGKLVGDSFTREGRAGHLGQHGFARTSIWREVGRSAEGQASVALELGDDSSTRAAFPWPFCVRLTYALSRATLRVDIEVQNPGSDSLPFGFGFHPYFAVPQADKARCRVPTQATRAWDNAAKRERALSGIDLTAAEVDLHLHDHGSSTANLVTPRGSVSLSASPEFGQWVVWTLRGKDFVCLEPWTCPGNALNTGTGLMALGPGQRRALSLRIDVAI